MYFLALDTTHSDLSLALFKNEQLIIFLEQKNNLLNIGSFFILLNQLFKESKIHQDKIQCIFINQGPGRFTSTRLGITITRAWVQLKNCAYIALNSFDILYESALNFYQNNCNLKKLEQKNRFIFIILNGFNNKTYIVNIYQNNSFDVLEKHLNLSLEAVFSKIKHYKKQKNAMILLIGHAIFLHADALKLHLNENNSIIIPENENLHCLNAKKLGQLAYKLYKQQKKSLSFDYKLLKPLYLWPLK